MSSTAGQAITLLVMAKAPVPGRVKTRLCPPYTHAQAADLAKAALLDTLRAVALVPGARRILVLDGRPGSWIPSGVEVHPQVGGELDERLANAMCMCTGPTVLLGSDTPQLRGSHLSLTFETHDAWFGPATDGGFWALGLHRPDPALLLGVPMSRPDTGRRVVERLTAAGLRVGRLPVLRDVDNAADAAAVAAAAPGTEFAARHRALNALA